MKSKAVNKNFLPISLDISGHKILIIGGGESAFKKLNILQTFDANVEVLAKEVSDKIKATGIKYYQKRYQKEDIVGYLMLYSCTNNQELDKQILEDGKQAGVLVNIHDMPVLCQFVSPAIYKKGNITIAVGSNGHDVFKSIKIRDTIKEFITEQNLL